MDVFAEQALSLLSPAGGRAPAIDRHATGKTMAEFLRGLTWGGPGYRSYDALNMDASGALPPDVISKLRKLAEDYLADPDAFWASPLGESFRSLPLETAKLFAGDPIMKLKYPGAGPRFFAALQELMAELPESRTTPVTREIVTFAGPFNDLSEGLQVMMNVLALPGHRVPAKIIRIRPTNNMLEITFNDLSVTMKQKYVITVPDPQLLAQLIVGMTEEEAIRLFERYLHPRSKKTRSPNDPDPRSRRKGRTWLASTLPIALLAILPLAAVSAFASWHAHPAAATRARGETPWQISLRHVQDRRQPGVEAAISMEGTLPLVLETAQRPPSSVIFFHKLFQRAAAGAA